MSCNWIMDSARVTCHFQRVIIHHELASTPYQSIVEQQLIVNRAICCLIEILQKLIDFLLQIEIAAIHRLYHLNCTSTTFDQQLEHSKRDENIYLAANFHTTFAFSAKLFCESINFSPSSLLFQNVFLSLAENSVARYINYVSAAVMPSSAYF
jgi:hypothetical protein